MRADIHDVARGRWKSLLPALGIPAAFLSTKHGPCPMCGGKDRYRWDDKDGTGSFYCNSCGPGSGVDLVMRVRKVDFLEAKKLVLEHVGLAPIQVAVKRPNGKLDGFVDAIWGRAVPLTGMDPVSKYLAKRGLKRANPKLIRYLPRAKYTHDDKTIEHHPAMVAKFVSPDANESTVHLTYLDELGNKAMVPKVRKLAPGKVPQGGAVRLDHSAETMGIAEGIETALSAAKLFEVPVWAALNSGALTKWVPPPTAKNIIVFGDCDASFAGQYAAFALAHRLRSEGYHVDVKLPELADTDWNDLLMSEAQP